jgi:hypothetical protein
VIVARLPALTCDFTHLRQDLQRTIKLAHEHKHTTATRPNASSGTQPKHSRQSALPFTRDERSGPQS